MLFKSWLGSRWIRSTRAWLACALSVLTLVLIGACTVQATNGGTLVVAWTVAGNTASTQCAVVGAQNVSITLTDVNGLQAGATTVSCGNGTTLFSGLSAGTYTVTANLLDASGNTLFTSSTATAVNDGSTSTDAIDFSTGTISGGAGSLTVTWTVESSATSAACSNANATNILLNLLNSEGSAAVAPLTVPCAMFTASFANVPAGNYTLTAQLLDANGADATTQASVAVTVSGATGSTQAVDFPSTSFQNGTTGSTTGTGSIAVTWTIEESTAVMGCGNHNAASISLQLYAADGVTPMGAPFIDPCTAFQATITNLAPGSYELSAQLVNSVMSVSTMIPPQPITVTDGGTATQAFDFPANSFWIKKAS